MKLKTLFVLLAICLFVVPASAQIKGYLSAQFLKSQGGGDYANGTFAHPLLGLMLSGDFNTSFSYGAEFRITDISQVEIDQAWIGLSSSDSFSLKLGLYLVPFGIYNQINRPYQTILINPPLNVQYCYPERWRDLGLIVEGSISGFVYSAYLGNGLKEAENLRAGQQFQDNNKDKGKGGRFGFRLGQGVEVAYSIYRSKYDNENSRTLTLHDADLNWTTQDWLIWAEYTKAIIHNPEGFSSGEAEGYFIQALIFLGTFQPFASYQKIRYTDPYHGRGFSSESGSGEGISLEENRWALGLRYVPVPNLYLTFEYDFNRMKDNENKIDLWALQVAISF
jgi:hypothetical protein